MDDPTEEAMLWAILFALVGVAIIWLYVGSLIPFLVTVALALACLAWLKLSSLKNGWQNLMRRARHVRFRFTSPLVLPDNMRTSKIKTALKPGAGALFLVSCAILLSSIFDYVTHGYSLKFLAYWLTAIFSLLFFFWLTDNKPGAQRVHPQKADVYSLVLVLLFFGVLYLSSPASYPIQMNRDEIVIRDEIRSMFKGLKDINLLGPSWYAGFPVFEHVSLGWVSMLFGGVTIDHLRTTHAFFGVLCISCAFVFFRILGVNRKLSIVATAILGFNHSFFSLSRFVSQYAVCPFIEIVTLTLLYRGVMTNSRILVFAGGIAAGATFYVHPPARITIFLFLLFYALNIWSFSKWKACLRQLSPLIFGFAIVVFPMLWAMKLTPPEVYRYQRDQFLFLPEGRKVEAIQVRAKSDLEGVWINIQQGLFAFNYPKNDCGNVYENVGFGFVDPLTGAMIWIGLLYLLIEWKERKAHRAADVLCVSSFLFLWLAFSFLITFAPSYGRLTITLPFVAYLAAHGLLGTAHALRYSGGELPKKWRTFLPFSAKSPGQAENILVTGLLGGIILLNFSSVWKMTNDALINGDREGATFRAIEGLKGNRRWHVVISGDQDYPFLWEVGQNNDPAWTNQDDVPGTGSVITPTMLKAELSTRKPDEKLGAPLMLFLDSKLWEEIRADFASRHPSFEIKNIVPDGSRLAVIVR